jgi:hypothetical protein
METARYAEKMFAFQKMTVDMYYEGLGVVQTRADKALDQMLDQMDWMPEEYTAPVRKWQGFSARQMDCYADFMKKMYSSVEPLFVLPKKKAVSKAQAARKSETVNKPKKMEEKNES